MVVLGITASEKISSSTPTTFSGAQKPNTRNLVANLADARLAVEDKKPASNRLCPHCPETSPMPAIDCEIPKLYRICFR
jgi:hypothetical protein